MVKVKNGGQLLHIHAVPGPACAQLHEATGGDVGGD